MDIKKGTLFFSFYAAKVKMSTPEYIADSYVSVVKATLSCGQSDWNNTSSRTQFNAAGPGSEIIAGTSVTTAEFTELAKLWDAFINGQANATSEQKNSTGAALGVNKNIILSYTPDKAVNPTNWSAPNLAQRENKWLIKCQDVVTGEIYSYTVPCANLSLLTDGSEVLPSAISTKFQAFLDGPVVNSKHIPLIVSNRGNRLKYLTSTYVGRSFKRQ